MVADISIREFQLQDFPYVQEIYQQGIETKNATFETCVPDWERWDKKFISKPRIVATNNDRVVGWVMLSPVSTRAVYAGVCEVSIFIHKNFQGKGIGKALLQELIIQSEQNNIWTLQAGIFPENHSSIKLHLNYGFRQVGYWERIGKMQDIWRDTILLERRSKKAGV
jgi:L-amino acid N-acyltransferase YncA